VLARDALAAGPAGLLTDFDGTLSPIVSDPASARLADGARAALERLVGRLAVVAIVTGRAPLDARRMTGVDGLLVAGNHGTEWLEPGRSTPDPAPELLSVRAALDGLIARVPLLEGVSVEDKGLSATVHYRSAPDPDTARDAIASAMAGGAPGIEQRAGRMSIELRPVGLGDKGSAVRTIVERFGLRGAVVMGDDVTDLDMFAAIGELRADGRLRAAIIGVGGADRDVPPEVADAADVVLASPEEAARLLAALAEPG
jgi:trehalose 6-phosphate phosphatase